MGIGLALLLCAGVYVYFRFDPTGSPYFPKCPFRLLTGLKCPGCGSQRAIHALLHGNLTGALKANPLFVIALPYLALWPVLEILAATRNSDTSKRWLSTLYGSKAAIVVLVIIILFWILRNI